LDLNHKIKEFINDLEKISVGIKKSESNMVINYHKYTYLAEYVSSEIGNTLKAKIDLLSFAEKLHSLKLNPELFKFPDSLNEKKIKYPQDIEKINGKKLESNSLGIVGQVVYQPKEIIIPLDDPKKALKNGLEINLPNYFNPNVKPFLHFFASSSVNEQTKIFFVWLPSENNEIPMVEVRNLRIKFQLPHWHGTLATPQGEIFFFGGAYSITGINK
jgi:hypothetical protein